MCDPNLLQSTKTILKYLINNGPREQTVNSIYFDFYEYANTHIPLFELGYSYLVTFLQSIPDILEVDPVTLQIRPSTYKSVSPFYNNNKFKNSSQCSGFMETSITFPRMLPWTQSNRESNKYEERASKALALKKPNSTSFPLGPRSYGDGRCSSSDSIMTDNGMEPDEESKYKTDQRVTISLVETVIHPIDPNNDIYFDSDILKNQNIFDVDKSIIRLDHTLSAKAELNKGDKHDFEEKTEPDLSDASSMVHKSRYSSSSVENEVKSDEQTKYEEDDSVMNTFVGPFVKLSKYSNDPKNDFYFDPEILINQNFSYVDENIIQFDHTPSAEAQLNIDDKPVFDEETGPALSDASSVLQVLSSSSSDMIDMQSHDDKQIEPTYDNDSDYYLSSSEEEAFIYSQNGAIPFMFTELDDKINMLSSCFFNGNYGCKYETTNIGELMKVGSVYELYVSEVNNPYKFWFQLDEEIPNSVEELQERLNECYDMTNCIPDLIKKEHMKKGYACAALYCKVWHRGEILGQVEDGKVGIYFVDYGTVDKVKIDEVRYLLNSFCSSPKLCHRGTLDFVKPINERWTVDATSFFIGLVENRKLTAGVTDVDRKNNSVRLYLIDSNTNINLNYTLVCEEYAYPDDPRDRYQQHIADVVPSFDSLEKGDHATFEEIATLLEQNYDYEELMHASVIDDFDFYIPTHVTDAETIERMQDFRNKKEEGQKLAKQRDAKVFLEIFGSVLQNPFFNGTMSDETIVSGTKNPFFFD